MVDESVIQSLRVLAESGSRLRIDLRFDWPEAVQHTVRRLLLNLADVQGSVPPLTAVVGGASSGKSTVFNNLLEGHPTSRITARGHATRGPILAVHEAQRPWFESLPVRERFLPGLRRVRIELDENACGEPDVLCVVWHTVDSLRDVLLFDMPDFTSEAALAEGDVALNLLPWFDGLVVVIDHERWFDRQTVSQLRSSSIRFGQRRFVLFNRTNEGALMEDTLSQLRRQAERFAADGMAVLDFRRGRGFCRFSPGTLDPVHAFLEESFPDRTAALLDTAAHAANQALNQNAERFARLTELDRSLRSLIDRVIPGERDCMISLMTPEERRQMEVVWRVLRASGAKDWFLGQTMRLRGALRHVPLLGAFLGAEDASPSSRGAADRVSRSSLAWAHFESTIKRLSDEAGRVMRLSPFWNELEAWTGLTPPALAPELTAEDRDEVRRSTSRFDEVLARWNAKVESECQGLSPHVTVGAGVGMVGLAVVLIAVPGPLSALTLIAAKSAVGAALTHLAAVSGAAALFGKQIGRLADVAREKLLGCAELDSVRQAAQGYQASLQVAARRLLARAIEPSFALVLLSDSPTFQALERLRSIAEPMP